MDTSIFSRIFPYRERQDHSPTENFLTEIFAFCIENDKYFRKEFFKSLLSIDIKTKNIEVLTQSDYKKYGRPDIEINYDKTSILIECKVDSKEGDKQLTDYSSILTKEKTKYQDKYLIYLTKHYEDKIKNIENVNFLCIRWFQIHDIINDTHSEIAQHLKLFINELGMESLSSFSSQEINAMCTFTGTLSKMNEVLAQVESLFQKNFKSFSWQNGLVDSFYIGYASFRYKTKEYYLVAGFYWWWDEPPYFGIYLRLPKRKFDNTDLPDIIRMNLVKKSNWFEDTDSNSFYFHSAKPVTEFQKANKESLPVMVKFIDKELKILKTLKEKYPKILTK